MTREELRDYVDEQRTLDNIPYHVYSTLIDGIDTLEQDPCEDAISRQAAIDVIERWLECSDYNEAERHIMRATESILYDLPSIKPQEPKTGHWIDGKCDNCGKHAPYLAIAASTYFINYTDYCPNCGCRMGEPQERSDK